MPRARFSPPKNSTEVFQKKFLPAKIVEVGGQVERIYQTSHDKDSKGVRGVHGCD